MSTGHRRRSVRLRGVDPNTPSASSAPSQTRMSQRANSNSKVDPRSLSNPTTEEEAIAEDDICPICRLLLYRPVLTRCNHTLCESCMARWADVSVVSQMKIVDVDTEPEAFNAVSGLEAKCPMCRTLTTAAFNAALSDRLAAQYPSTYEERGLEEDDQFGEDAAVQTLAMYIGNRHAVVEPENERYANKHAWTFFVRPSRTDFLEEVQIVLHPTFRPNRIIRQRPPYEIRRMGWGIFTLTAYVILKAGYTWVSTEAEDSPDGAPKGMLPLNWTLDFEGFGGKGSMGSCRLKVKNDRQWQVSDEGEEDDREWQRAVRQYQRDGVYEPPSED